MFIKKKSYAEVLPSECDLFANRAVAIVISQEAIVTHHYSNMIPVCTRNGQREARETGRSERHAHHILSKGNMTLLTFDFQLVVSENCERRNLCCFTLPNL